MTARPDDERADRERIDTGKSNPNKPGTNEDASEQSEKHNPGSGPQRTTRRGGARAEPVRLTAAQQKMVADNVGLIGVHLRKRVPTPRRPSREREYDDLFQEGCVALARAAARFRPGVDGPFAAFALPRIRGAIHVALHERFSLIRVPSRTAAGVDRSDRGTHTATDTTAQSLSNNTAAPSTSITTAETIAGTAPRAAAPSASRPSVRAVTLDDRHPAPEPSASESEHGITIAHLLHERYERELSRALDVLATKKRRGRDPVPIMKRIAAERLLVVSESRRTSMRQLARDTALSSGRIFAYEAELAEETRAQFARDPALVVLHRFIETGDRGPDTPLDDTHLDQLAEAELDAFEQRFDAMDRAERATMMYDLIERSSPAVPVIARNLYQLTMCA